MSYRLGDFLLRSVSAGSFRLDGGNMFGVVPKPLWQKKKPPDDRNRIQLDTNALVVRAGSKTIIVDTGYGTKNPPKDYEINALEQGTPLLTHLAAIGLKPDDIDFVIFSHLHFDHAGGAVIADSSGKLVPAFPRARYIAQQDEWDDATANAPELAGSYFERDFLPLKEAGQLDLVRGVTQILPGVSVEQTGGHTRGHQVIRLESNGHSAVYMGDLCPTTSHIRPFWTMAYDQSLLDTRRAKSALFSDIADHKRLAVFDHDPNTRAAYIARDPKETFVITQTIELRASHPSPPGGEAR